MLRIIFRFVGGGLGEKISNEKNEKLDTKWEGIKMKMCSGSWEGLEK